jgi:hypothetical protein
MPECYVHRCAGSIALLKIASADGCFQAEYVSPFVDQPGP